MKVHGVFGILPAIFHTEHLTSRETDPDISLRLNGVKLVFIYSAKQNVFDALAEPISGGK